MRRVELLLLASSLWASEASVVKQPDEARGPASDGGAFTRPLRGSSFDAPAPDEVGSAAGNSPSAEWKAASEGIVSEMRAHLERRKTNEDADIIRSKRNVVFQAVLGVRDFVRSKALGNVFRSLGLFIA